MKQLGVISLDQGGGKGRSDFVSVNLDNDATVNPGEVAGQIIHHNHLGAHLFARKERRLNPGIYVMAAPPYALSAAA